MQPRSRGSRCTRNPIRVNRRIITRPCPIHGTLNNRWHPLGLVRLLKCVRLRPAITNSSSNNNNTIIITTRTTITTSSSSSSSHRSCRQLNNNITTTTTTTSISTTTIDRRIKTIIDLEALSCRLRRRLNRRRSCRRGSRRPPMGPTRPTRVRTACRPST